MTANGPVRIGGKLSDGELVICRLLASGLSIETNPTIEGQRASEIIVIGGICFFGTTLVKLQKRDYVGANLQLTERGAERFPPGKTMVLGSMRH